MDANGGICDDDRVERQRQARALGDPTRFAIFCRVLDAPAPVRVDALTEEFKLNHNAVRQHLAKLVGAGLLEEAPVARQGRGRPALFYRAAPEGAATWTAQSPYQQLSLLLLQLARGRGTPLEVGAAAGRSIDVADAEDPLARLTDEMARRGFRPIPVARAGGFELVLGRCPFEAVAVEAPDVICRLHRGLAVGILEAVGGDYEVEDLVAHDPRSAGCRLQVRPVAQPLES
jgi:predicted ArsR family transcriptional regulator